MSDKYKMFKNFLHNELGISKDDIKEWIRESIKEECKNVVEQTYETFNIKTFLKSEIENILSNSQWYNPKTLKEEVYKEVAKRIIKMHDINLTLKEKNKND